LKRRTDLPREKRAVARSAAAGGSRVTFVNDDARVHDKRSDPLHLQIDWPELNVVGMVVPGQSRASDPLQHVRPCGFHDHVNEGDVLLWHGVRRSADMRLAAVLDVAYE
jgi:hypothetical protein